MSIKSLLFGRYQRIAIIVMVLALLLIVVSGNAVAGPPEQACSRMVERVPVEVFFSRCPIIF